MSGSHHGPGRKAPRPGGATANGSLYERYKDALRRGHVAALRGRSEAAIDAYGEAASIAPDRALPHTSLGGILVRMDRLNDAVAAYDRALALAARDEGALRGLAEVQIRTGRRTDAATTLDRLADSFDETGRLADATDAARRALELAESRARRRQVEEFARRLRAAAGADETAQRALDQALRVLEPTQTAATGVETAAGGATEAPRAPDAGEPAPTPEPEPEPEPVGLGIALGAAAEAALQAGDLVAAHDGLLAAARAHRRAGRLSAAIDACYLAIGLGPSDPGLHLLLVELYLDRGWRGQAMEKLLLLGRLADLDDDQPTRDLLCGIVAERLADEPRVASLCA